MLVENTHDDHAPEMFGQSERDRITNAVNDRISPQHQDVLVKLMDGLSEKEIASALQMTTGAVHRKVRDLYQHFGVHSRSELMSRMFVNLLQKRSGGPNP